MKRLLLVSLLFIFGCKSNTSDIYEFSVLHPISSNDTTHYVAKIFIGYALRCETLTFSKYPNMRFKGSLYKIIVKEGKKDTLLLREEI